jgi:hypothetical protein
VIVRANYTAYEGPENRRPLVIKPYENSTHTIRIGWIYVNAIGWPRVEVDPGWLAL